MIFIPTQRGMLIDTNILIYAINTSSPKHGSAQQFLRERRANLVVADQNVLEALRVLTHGKYSHPITFFQAEKAVTAMVSAMTIVSPNEETLPTAILLMQKYARAANRIFDAYLVATMLTHGVKEIATDNERDFQIFAEISVFNPFNLH
jgi:predicted nucleic acid-binding protein